VFKKYVVATLLALALLLTPLPVAVAAPTVVVDGQVLKFDVPPLVEKGRILVPLRGVFEAINAEVTYDAAQNTILATRGEVVIVLHPGDTLAHKNGQPLYLDVPAKSVKGRTMIPLRLVGEALGVVVEWDSAAKTVQITSRSGELVPAGDVSDSIERDFAWEYGGYEWSWSISIQNNHYGYFQSLPRPQTDDYSVYVTNQLDDYYITSLVDRFKEAARQHNLSDYEMVDFAVSFVQNLDYVPDNVNTGYDEYPRYPLETLVDRGGDCEDTSILLASILREMGYGVVLLALPDHMAVGVKGTENLPGAYWDYEGSRYYYVETTGTGWQIGKIPVEYKGAHARVLPLIPRPVINHNWEGQGTGLWYKVTVVVKNEGTAPAENTVVYAAFDAGNGKVYDQAYSQPRIVGVRGEEQYTLNIKYPYDTHTRLIVKVLSNGKVVDESSSDWLDT